MKIILDEIKDFIFDFKTVYTYHSVYSLGEGEVEYFYDKNRFIYKVSKDNWDEWKGYIKTMYEDGFKSPFIAEGTYPTLFIMRDQSFSSRKVSSWQPKK